MTKKIIMSAFAVLLLISACAAQTTVLKSGAREALISCRFSPVVLTKNGQGQTIPAIAGCRTEGEPGQPIILYQQVMVGIPQNAKAEVQIVSGDYDERSGIELAAIPYLETQGQEDLGSYVYKKQNSLSNGELLPLKHPALLYGTDILRRHRVALVRVYPVQYDQASGKLRVYRTMQVRIAWDTPGISGAAADDDVYGPLLAGQIINYQESKHWLVESPKSGSKAYDPFGAASVWYKMSLVNQGIYRLDYNYLKRNGIDPDIIDPRTIKIFNGGSRAFTKNYLPPGTDSLKQMSILVKGEQDGRFNPGDQIIFFGQNLVGWDKNSALPNGQFYNPYGDTNCYWLCWGGTQGLRMTERDCRPLSSGTVTPLSFADTLHFELDVFNPFNSGELWYWLNMKRMTVETVSDYSLPFDLSYAQPGPAQVKINYRAGTSSRHHLNWGLNGALDRQLIWSGSPLSGDVSDSISFSELSPAVHTLNLQLNRSSADTMDIVYLNWFEVYYRRKYTASNYNLSFRADSLSGQPYKYHLKGFASDSQVILDVSHAENPISLRSDRIFEFYTEFEDDWKPGRLYWAASSPGWQRPVKIEPYVLQDLRENYQDINYLIIAADEFWPQAQALLALHSGESRLQPAAVVKLSWVYNEFSFGLKDPSAIRRFLDHLYLNSSAASPKRCLLFGDGSYDYRALDRTWGRHNFIPTHQEDVLFSELGEYIFSSFDDWYVRLNGSSLPQLILARMPAKTADEAWTAVAKATGYRSLKGPAEWRNKAVLMADDEFVSGGVYAGETIHTTDSEYLAQHCLPGSYDMTKVYSVMREYTMDSEHHKPDARAALIGCWNLGAGLINFFGHGSYWVWGHEWYFRDTDVANLANGERLPLVVMGTCGTSRFDMSRYESIGTSLVVKKGGGAIATVGATRGTYSSGNFNLAKGIYDSLFTGRYDIGQSFFTGKLASGGNPLYVLMGDPALNLSRPSGVCSLSLNADTLRSRGIYSVAGRTGGSDTALDGQALLTLYDVTRQDSSLYTHSLKYEIPGRMLLKFGAEVRNDSLGAMFILPNMAAIRPETLPGARLGVYAWGTNGDASGVLKKELWIGGSDTVAFSDTAKPGIELWSNGIKLDDGDIVEKTSLLTVRIKDDRGINIIPFSASQIDLAQVLIDGTDLRNISGDFVYDAGSCNSGQIIWAVPASLKEDTLHRFKFTVYDLTAKKGFLELGLKVLSWSGLNKIDGLFNYPNPFKQGTCFTFNLYQGGDVVVKIYTIGGRMIKTLVQNARNYGYNQIYWDGRDADGSLLANGVYFYKITVKGQSGEASALGKMVVMK